MHQANEKRCYVVTSSPIGWAHTLNDHIDYHSASKLKDVGKIDEYQTTSEHELCVEFVGGTVKSLI